MPDLVLPPMPEAVARLPRDPRGYPVPFFVADAESGRDPDLRVADDRKRAVAYRSNLCWICGQVLGKWRVFLGGPLSAANCVSSDWCQHRDCAHFALRACPFLNGGMRRRPGREYPAGAVASVGALDDRPPVSIASFTRRPVQVTAEGLFLFVSDRLELWRDGAQVAPAVALPLIEAYLDGLEGLPAELRAKVLLEVGRAEGPGTHD